MTEIEKPLRLVVHLETAEGEGLSDPIRVPVDDDLLTAPVPDRRQDAFVHAVTRAATDAYRQGVGK